MTSELESGATCLVNRELVEWSRFDLNTFSFRDTARSLGRASTDWDSHFPEYRRHGSWL